ncbi:MAG: hypothetical protein ACYC6A_13320 [Armatimonadota bacterium]
MPDYQGRDNQVEEWKRRFPDNENEVLRFINIINNAFLLGRKMRDKVHPDDRITELYEACLPNPQWFLQCDNMELEHLIFLTEDAFHCVLSHNLDGLEGRTFGDLFEEAKRATDN